MDTTPDLYPCTDQIMIKALMCLGVFPEKVNVNQRHQLEWIFCLSGTFKNNGSEYTVKQTIDDLRMGHLEKYTFTLNLLWAAENFWQMNLRHRDVLSDKA